MSAVGRTVALLSIALLATTDSHAQEHSAARTAYFEAVADFFELPPREVAILGDWGISPDEIPAVLFVAHHAGVSPEALVALRRAGRTWSDLTVRYGIGAQVLHVPIRDQAPAGALAGAYVGYRGTPIDEWHAIRLSDSEVIALVNVRVIAETLGLSAEEVVLRTESVSSYVALFTQLNR